MVNLSEPYEKRTFANVKTSAATGSERFVVAKVVVSNAVNSEALVQSGMRRKWYGNGTEMVRTGPPAALLGTFPEGNVAVLPCR